MATQPTNLPDLSESPRDLKFNAGKFDEYVTSMGRIYTDRFGVKHYTIEGMNNLSQQAMAAYGYVILTGKTFTTGTTLNNPNQVLLNTADGEYYKWTGSFASGGNVVPANSTPAGTGGIGTDFALAGYGLIARAESTASNDVNGKPPYSYVPFCKNTELVVDLNLFASGVALRLRAATNGVDLLIINYTLGGALTVNRAGESPINIGATISADS